MTTSDALQPDPTAIGEVSAPPFARLPDPAALFAARAARLRSYGTDNPIGGYLSFVAAVVEAQQRALGGLPEPVMPDAAALGRAHDFAMPPLDRGRFVPDEAASAALDRLFDELGEVAMPAEAAAARDRAAAASPAERAAMVGHVLADALPVEALAEHVFVAAAMQVDFARRAARLDVKELVPVGEGVCPSCGGPPVGSMVVGWQGAHGTRFCACALCGTLWHHVRVKCVLCGSTKGIGYQHVEGGSENAKAETCDQCGGYVKIFSQLRDHLAEPLADDVATLGLDMLMRDGPYRRGGFNPFLAGY